MFTHYGKKTKSAQRKSIQDLTAVASPELLLAEKKRAALLLQIEQACVFGPGCYGELCSTLVSNLVNHCQLLPETAHNYYAQPGGILDYALNRTEAALVLFRQFVILEENQAAWSDDQKLWQYVLYSAALLQGIGKLQVDYQISLYDKERQSLGDWNPLLGGLASAGHYYAYHFEKEAEITLRRRLNLLIARQLMPVSGFAWIAENPDALAVWLALLNEDYQGAGTLGAILIRADALALRRYFNQFLGGGHGVRTPRNRVGTFAGSVPESIQDIEAVTGAHFLQWLTAAIESGVLMINKAPLLSVPGGLLMCPDIFKLFIRETPEYKNILVAQKAFMSLGVHQVGPQGETDFRVEKSSNHEAFQGMIFSAYAMVLPDQVSVYQNDSNNATSMSAVECIHQLQASPALQGAQAPLLHLSNTGQWIAHAARSHAPFLGMPRRG